MDIILAIKYAESQSEEIECNATAEARRILSEANNQAYKLLEQSIENSEKEAKDILKKAEMEANFEVEKRKKSLKEENSGIIRNASSKLGPAVDLIVERIVKVHGSC